MNYSDLITDLTTRSAIRNPDLRDAANAFARDFGWRPSDYSPAIGDEIANAHLLVEHGLKNTAVLTFLYSPTLVDPISANQVQGLLNFSYNNLIDWHLLISRNEVLTVFNRIRDSSSRVVSRVDLRGNEKAFDELRSDRFEKLIGKRPSPNVPALDDVLIKTISDWKRNLSVEIDGVTNRELSALFNAIIFTRAVEDSKKHSQVLNGPTLEPFETFLVREWTTRENGIGIGRFLSEIGTRLLQEEIPGYLIEADTLELFDRLDSTTVKNLLSSFYYHESIPYRYDFSVMSKHALSRIYEQYVSILKTIEPIDVAQRSLFPLKLPKQETNKAYGAYYTPQYLARFFARFFAKNTAPHKLRSAKIMDPACGSGIFLRTFLEQRLDQVIEDALELLLPAFVEQSMSDVTGIDIDPNATHATSLSLALLQLALKTSFPDRLRELQSFPNQLNLIECEAIQYIADNYANLSGTQDVVVANPPFVRLEDQPPAIRERIRDFTEGQATGRISSELAFLLLALDLLKDDGIACFVLQHSFTYLESAKAIRQLLSEETDILCLADLSGIDVFKDTGVYTLLLIFQKRVRGGHVRPAATLVQCKDFVEQALQSVLDRVEIDREAYSVYEVDQGFFERKHWTIVRQSALETKSRLEQYPKLRDYFELRQGLVSGADDIFIRNQRDVPRTERLIYQPLLPDREMTVYTVPKTVDTVVFYPYIDGHPITEDDLINDFPQTWTYLSDHREKLQRRAGIQENNWWKPTRARSPERMMRPKIVSPHLTISPRFSIDLEGKYAVTRAPIMYPKDDLGNEKDLLKYFAAVLNSRVCFWYISNHSFKYKKGYSKLELKTLAETPVPAPNDSPVIVRHIIDLVDQRLMAKGSEVFDLEQRIDSNVSLLYELSENEKEKLGIAY